MSFTSKTLFSNRGKLNPEEGNVSDTYCAYDHLHLYAVVCNNISKFCTPGFFSPNHYCGFFEVTLHLQRNCCPPKVSEQAKL